MARLAPDLLDKAQQLEKSGALEATWQAQRPGGHFFFAPLTTPKRLARYVTKDFFIPEARENIFHYTPWG